MELDGRTALITGGASGLGEATVRQLRAAGANVVVVDLPGSSAQRTAKELGEQAAFAAADVTDPDAVAAAVGLATQRFGGLHVAVNCAGVAVTARTLTRQGPHDLHAFRRVVEVNLVGTFNVIRLVAAQMAVQDHDGGDRGEIVNTASIAAFEGQVGQVAYAASKGGVASLTLPVARDLAGLKIRCVTIAPGTFDTPMLAVLPVELRERLADSIPHPHRIGRPEEFARLVRHVVENPYLNGTVIRLDGALRLPPR